MLVVEPYFEILYIPPTDEILRVLQLAARNCYKSEDKIKEGSAEDLLRRLLRTKHDSVFEHMGVTIRLVADRGILAEITRHRTGIGFSVESSRYANYSKEKFGSEITVIRPFYFIEGTEEYLVWEQSMKDAERAYLQLISMGKKAQEARAVLPFSLKTDIVFTANLRELRHILKLRCGKASHPQMRQVMLPILAEMFKRVPVLFSDLYEVYQAEIEGILVPKEVTSGCTKHHYTAEIMEGANPKCQITGCRFNTLYKKEKKGDGRQILYKGGRITCL